MPDVTIAATDTVANAALDDVLVRIYSAGVFVTSGVTGEGTNAAGERLFTLPAGDYTMRLSMADPGYTVPSPQSFSVAGSDVTFDVSVAVTAAPQSSNPLLCRCSGYVVDAAGVVCRGATFGLLLADGPMVLSRSAVFNAAVQATSDSAGYVQIDLIRGAIYRVTYDGDDAFSAYCRIPDAASANFADVVFPVVSSVTFSPSSLAIGVGATGEVAVTVRYRSGMALGIGEFAALPVEFSGDLSISQGSGNMLLISSAVAGTFTVTVARVEQEDARTRVLPTTALSSTLVVVVS